MTGDRAPFGTGVAWNMGAGLRLRRRVGDRNGVGESPPGNASFSGNGFPGEAWREWRI